MTCPWGTLWGMLLSTFTLLDTYMCEYGVCKGGGQYMVRQHHSSRWRDSKAERLMGSVQKGNQLEE